MKLRPAPCRQPAEDTDGEQGAECTQRDGRVDAALGGLDPFGSVFGIGLLSSGIGGLDLFGSAFGGPGLFGSEFGWALRVPWRDGRWGRKPGTDLGAPDDPRGVGLSVSAG